MPHLINGKGKCAFEKFGNFRVHGLVLPHAKRVNTPPVSRVPAWGLCKTQSKGVGGSTRHFSKEGWRREYNEGRLYGSAKLTSCRKLILKALKKNRTDRRACRSLKP
jgi:hypothetical protein